MPRHTDPRFPNVTFMDTEPSARPSGKDFVQARERRVVYVTPEPVWILDSYRVRRWYYHAAPDVGEKVHYLQDGFGARVTRVTTFAIYFDDANVMRRGYFGGRLVAWSLPRLRTLTTRLRSMPRTGSTNGPASTAPSRAGSTPKQLVLHF